MSIIVAILFYYLGWRARSKKDVFSDFQNLFLLESFTIMKQMFLDLRMHDPGYQIFMPQWFYFRASDHFSEGSVIMKKGTLADKMADSKKDVYYQENAN